MVVDLVQDDQVHTAVLERLGQLDHVLEGAAELVELGNYQLALGSVGYQQRLAQLGPGGGLAGCFVDEDLSARGSGERVVLRFGVLVAGEDPPVADSHGPEVYCEPPTG